MRLLCATALALSAGLFAACGDDTKKPTKEAIPTPEERGERLKKIQATFTAERDDIVKRFRTAPGPQEQAGLRTEAKELAAITASKLLAITETNPKDDISLSAAQLALTELVRFGLKGDDLDKLMGIVTDHHLNNPKVKDLLAGASTTGPAGEKLLTTASERSEDKNVKGVAFFYLGKVRADQADDAPDEKAADEAIRKAIELLERAGKEAPEAKIKDLTLDKAAAAEIKTIQGRSVGYEVADVEGAGLDGKKARLSGFKGKVVLLDIWATWCPPCRAMIPHEREMVKKFKEKPFVLLSASVDDEKQTLTAFLEKEPMPWSHWWIGQESELLQVFRIQAFPTLYLIDAKGVIRKKWVGAPPNDVLDKAVNELVKEALAKG